jgi:hypothetical protein
MAYMGGRAGLGDARLWAGPTGALPAPPVDTRSQVLPIGELDWPDAEKLFLRLLDTVRPVQYAKLFGVPGQAQAGIDAYARLPLELTGNSPGGRDYITLQSRRVKSLTAARVKKAVDDLLKGEWADRTSAFYFATSFDLQDSKLDVPIRQQTERLAKLGISFVPWGVQELSGLLKDHPLLVDDFFGRPWVERFCGLEAAKALADNLSRQDSSVLRAGLRDLYQSVFSAQGGASAAEGAESGQKFVILDVDPSPQQSETVTIELPEQSGERQDPSQSPRDGRVSAASRLSGRRQSFRSARQLVNDSSRVTSAADGIVAADEWLAGGQYRLLVGLPGAGKSSLLRFTARDLLSSLPQSVALQREHAGDLPVWLPFGFLCRHLEASTENSLVSAAEAWLKSQSAAHLWPLVHRALQDDRLLLLVDGIDEWSNVAAAEHALGIIESFLARTRGSAILSTRPYAVDRLNWTNRWELAEITPLTDQRRRCIAAGILRPVSGIAADSAAQSAWTAGVEPFLEQLAVAPELDALSRSPLFLTLLATTWQGEPLPQQRFKIYTRLVELLVEKHPQMRMRASRAQGAPLSADDMTSLFAAVAYHLRVKDPAGAVTKAEMRKLIVESMTDDQVLGYADPAARRIADAVLAVAEDEFGLIVSHGAGAVGFLHRVILDHLAGQYLARLPADLQAEAVQRFVHDPGWRDVLLAQLSAQVNPYATEQLITAATTGGGSRWADIDGYELAADALAAGVKLTPKTQAGYVSCLVERAETHPALRHRANIITALAAMLAGHTARTHLLPVMKRWLTASRPDPSPAMWALRDLGIADDLAADCLFWGLRHPEDSVKVNAALAIARRFAGQARLAERLAATAETGPSSATQAAAILALGNGWAGATETGRLVSWARCQPSVPLRLAALDVLLRGNPDDKAALLRSEERDWLLSLLYDEDFRRTWPVADLVNLAASGDAKAADFALETLTANGRNGGDRSLAWFLACNAFADDNRFKAWVTAQLASPDQHGLTLFNVSMIPQQWRDDPAFAQALRPYVQAELAGALPYNVTGLATSMPPPDARAALLRGLDSGRPYSAAAMLAERYLGDDQVREALTNRLCGNYAQAAPMAGVAIDVLGPAEGLAVLVSLLRQPDQAGRYEERVVVAQAVADAWQRLVNASRKQDAEAGSESEALASYDPAELAALCTSVGPYPLMWHAPSVIGAWPGQSAVQRFAGELIDDPAAVAFGIEDTVIPAILRAYTGRTDKESEKILGKTLSLFKHIEPELREVLAFELARSPLSAHDRVEAMSGWRHDPDTEVRRITFIGLIQAIKRDQHAHDAAGGGRTAIPELEWLRQEIRRDLCAYGPQFEERRQLAWIGTLMLGDLTLIDGIKETSGDSSAPAVKLEVLYDGDVDQILVDLVAENWDRLRAHFGESVFERLNGKPDSQRRAPGEQRLHVMSALATAASRHPAIADMLRREADAEPALRQDRHFLLWAKEENRGDEETLRALAAKSSNTMHRWQDTVLESLLDRESWNVTDETFMGILTEDGTSERPARSSAREKLAAYAQLFPTAPMSLAALRDLESWFRAERTTRASREWGDTLAIALGVAEPEDLPAIAARVHPRIRRGISELYLPLFTKPLIRRLQADADAAETFKKALGDPKSIREDSPIFAGPGDPIADAHPELQPLHRAYLFAVALRQAGVLSQQDSASATGVLAAASPDTVVHNPFTDHEGPLRLAILDLTVR